MTGIALECFSLRADKRPVCDKTLQLVVHVIPSDGDPYVAGAVERVKAKGSEGPAVFHAEVHSAQSPAGSNPRVVCPPHSHRLRARCQPNNLMLPLDKLALVHSATAFIGYKPGIKPQGVVILMTMSTNDAAGLGHRRAFGIITVQGRVLDLSDLLNDGASM